MEAASEEDDTPILDSVQAGHLGAALQILGVALVLEADQVVALAEDFPEVEDHPVEAALAENFKE